MALQHYQEPKLNNDSSDETLSLEIFVYFFINFYPDLTQTQILTPKLTLKLTQILTLKKSRK